MSRHIIDNRTPSDGGRLRHFYRIERAGDERASHAIIRRLHQRPQLVASSGHLRQYLRIARGLTA